MSTAISGALNFLCSMTACAVIRRCRRPFSTTAAAGMMRLSDTDIPDASWTPGENQPTPFIKQAWRQFDPSSGRKFSIYNLLISCVVPRPIALVTTVNAAGARNCAPFSYFSCVGHEPPMVSITICTQGRNRVQKDTLNNILETNEFVVNIMSEWFVESANHTCGAFPPETDEIALSGLTTVPSSAVKPPRVAESAVHLECQVSSHFAAIICRTNTESW